MSAGNTSILDNFVKLITQQIDKYAYYDDNSDVINRLFDGLVRACIGMKKILDISVIKEYEIKIAELQIKYRNKVALEKEREKESIYSK